MPLNRDAAHAQNLFPILGTLRTLVSASVTVNKLLDLVGAALVYLLRFARSEDEIDDALASNILKDNS